MNLKVLRLSLALTLLAGLASSFPCFAQEDPARKATQQKLLGGIKNAMIKVELGPNAKLEGRISADLVSALIALQLTQNTKLTTVNTPDDSTGTILAFFETAPSRFNANVRILCVRLQVLQHEELQRAPKTDCAQDITWQSIRFCDESIVALPSTTATLVGLIMTDLVAALIAQNPGLKVSQLAPESKGLAVPALSLASVPSPPVQPSRIGEGALLRTAGQGLRGEGDFRSASIAIRLGMPETEEDGVVETNRGEKSGSNPLAGRDEPNRLVKAGWYAPAGGQSSSEGSGTRKVEAGNSVGAGAEPFPSYRGRAGRPAKNHPRLLDEAVSEFQAALFGDRKVGED
jgi:hypothetical protein